MDPTNFLGYEILDNYLNYEISSHSLVVLLPISVIWLLCQSATEVPFAKAPKDLGGRKLTIGENLKNHLVQHVSSVWQPHQGGVQVPICPQMEENHPKSSPCHAQNLSNYYKYFFLY